MKGSGFEMLKPMNKRRREIRRLMTLATGPLTGGELAERFDVTRQVIVQDMAILRAEGEPIVATPSGYLMIRTSVRNMPYRVFVCRHNTPETALVEMLEIVRLNGRIIDIVIEHPLYGEITGMLHISNEDEVHRVMEKLSGEASGMLSAATGGVHMHTVEAKTEEILDQIEKALRQIGILCD